MQTGTIRKIIIGKEVTQNAMNFQIGQPVISRTYNIHSIVEKEDKSKLIYIMEASQYKDYKKTGVDAGEIIVWKKIDGDLPSILEYSQDFS